MNKNELIDEIIVTLKYDCNQHSLKIGDVWVSMQDFRYTTIKDITEKLEMLKEKEE